MKKQLLCFGLVIFLFAMGMTSVQSTVPLTGKMELRFNLGYPGPQETVPDWVGHITIDGVQYGMLFFNIGTGKPFLIQKSGSAHFFGEKWYIYESINFHFDVHGVATIIALGPVVLTGNDQGIVSRANSLYRMNGEVEVAHGIFQDWVGYQVHMSGIIQWSSNGAPYQAPGQFQIN